MSNRSPDQGAARRGKASSNKRQASLNEIFETPKKRQPLSSNEETPETRAPRTTGPRGANTSGTRQGGNPSSSSSIRVQYAGSNYNANTTRSPTPKNTRTRRQNARTPSEEAGFPNRPDIARRLDMKAVDPIVISDSESSESKVIIRERESPTGSSGPPKGKETDLNHLLRRKPPSISKGKETPSASITEGRRITSKEVFSPERAPASSPFMTQSSIDILQNRLQHCEHVVIDSTGASREELERRMVKDDLEGGANYKTYKTYLVDSTILKKDEVEQMETLHTFDITSRFGPCIGIPRRQRWWRSKVLGLNPPTGIYCILDKYPLVWNGRYE